MIIVVRQPATRRCVAQRDYGAYDEIDQAVWRFILLQIHARLVKTKAPIERGLRYLGLEPRSGPRGSWGARAALDPSPRALGGSR